MYKDFKRLILRNRLKGFPKNIHIVFPYFQVRFLKEKKV